MTLRWQNIGKFAVVPLWLLEHPAVRTNAHAVRVYAILHARCGNPEGRLWIKQDKLAADLFISLDTVQRALAALREAGALRTVPRSRSDGSRSSLEYRLIHERPAKSAKEFKGPERLNRTGAVQDPKPHPCGTPEPHPCGSGPGAKTAPMRFRPEAILTDPDTYRQSDLLRGVGTHEGVRADVAPDPAPLAEDSPATHESEAQPDLPLRAPLVLANPLASTAARLPPPFLDTEFRARCGSAAIDLPAWYTEVLAAIGDRPIAQSLKAFWLAAFERDIGPQLAAAGGVAIVRELPLTRTDLEEAKQIRDRVWVSCRHEPRCVSYDACLAAIAWARRGEQTTRPRSSSA
jgi:hypothetical protein